MAKNSMSDSTVKIEVKIAASYVPLVETDSMAITNENEREEEAKRIDKALDDNFAFADFRILKKLILKSELQILNLIN
ncbi:9755_t:CDS:2 [Racocetra persica]|uniref:9755_t:CDS:1 n=1 Tax=Racocetra persica TaxID=160502 RepID=A0ACA9KQG9_9GLOM|nr:9755_t:CDS:2 [Racocetra persica]